MMTKAKQVAPPYSEVVDTAFKEHFDIETETVWNIFAMALVSSRKDDKPLALPHKHFLAGFEKGYQAGKACTALAKSRRKP